MKLIYSKLWLKKFIKYNHNKYDRKTLKTRVYGHIVQLSHRVFKGHGIRGHNIRQNIRKQLLAYALMEMNHYHITTRPPSLLSRILSFFKTLIHGDV